MPFYATPYKTAEETDEKLKEKVEELMEAGILEVCNSPWNSPIIGVTKKDGTIRVVNNYAVAVNKRLVMPRFPLESTRSIFGKVGREVSRLRKMYPKDDIHFTTMDFRSGYFSIPIEGSSRDVTAFSIGNMQVRYKKCPQGISIAPSCYSAYIFSIFGNFIHEGTFICHYLDDALLVTAGSVTISALEAYFKLARENNVIVALEKCKFASSRLEYLGHMLSCKGLEGSENKHKIILELEDPKTLREAQQVAGILNYYTRLTPRLSTLLSPLYQEIKKGKQFNLNPAISKGLERLKELIKDGLGTYHLDYSQGNFQPPLSVYSKN